MKTHNLKSLLLTTLFFNLSINYLILNSQYSFFSDIPTQIRFLGLVISLLFAFLLNYQFKKNEKLDETIIYIAIFIVFSLINLIYIQPSYFWEAIPDSATYKNLGNSLLSCFKLSLSCTEMPYLLFPIGQPFISGILSSYLYDYAHYFNILLVSFTIYLISLIAKKHYLKTSGIGIFYLLSHSLIYELTPMQISEVSFTFLLFFMIYIYLQNFKNKDNVSSLLYGFLILIRPIALALLPIFIFIYKKSKVTIIVFITVLVVAASFNFITADKFIISDFNVDSREDGLINNEGYFDYFAKLLKSDSETKIEFINFINDNYQRLYGESSKDCDFVSVCFFYNPKYNLDGTESSYFVNSRIGSLFNNYLIIFYNLRAPQNLFLYVLPIVIIFPFFFRRFRVEKFYSASLILLTFPTLLTVEYGNRWNFTLIFLSSLIIEMCSSNIIYKHK